MLCKVNELLILYRALAPGFLEKDFFGLQTLQHLMKMTRTWDSTMSMIPKGGDTIWGNLDWSPEGYDNCSGKKQKSNVTDSEDQNDNENLGSVKNVNYGRIISFGKDVAGLHSSKLERLDIKVIFQIYKIFIFRLESLYSLCFQWLNDIVFAVVLQWT